MTITDFINTYGQYLPNDEIILLKAAGEFYKSLRASDPFLYGLWPDQVDIEVVPGASGTSTSTDFGKYRITYPSGNDGFAGVPVGDIPGWEIPRS